MDPATPDTTFIAVGINDQLLSTILLEWVCRQVDGDGTLSLADPGGRDGLRRMRNLSPSDMRRIAEHAQKCISVVVNREGLLKAIDDAAADREAADNLHFLLNNGATRDLIADVLGVSDDRILNARSRLGTCSNARGRPKMPSANEREEIVARWHELSHLPDIERFRILRAQFPRWNIASLSACIKEFLLERPQPQRASALRDVDQLALKI